MSDEESFEGFPKSKVELIERIRQSRAALEQTLGQYGEAELTAPGPEGWSVKDHVAHMAAWEQGIVELLQKRPRFEAMGPGVREAVNANKSEDEINAILQQHYAGKSLAETLEFYRAVNDRMMAVLEELSEEDLMKPYASYTPDGSGSPDRPVVAWINGNTFDHYDSHHVWIKELLERQRD